MDLPLPNLEIFQQNTFFDYEGIWASAFILSKSDQIHYKAWSFNEKFEPIAFAILATEFEFNKAFKRKSFFANYSKIRQDIADRNFNGNAGFSICDLLSRSYFRSGAIRKDTCLPAEWHADASFFDCLNICKEKQYYKVVDDDL